MEIKPLRYRLSGVLCTVFFPFTHPEVIDSLKKRGYNVFPSPRLIPVGQRVYVGGHIATKKGCTVEINDDRELISIEGSQIENVIQSFEEIMDMAKEDFQLDLENDVNYIELITEIKVKSDGNPIEKIDKFIGDRYRIFDEIMGIDTSGFSIRIVPKGFRPSDKEWFDITIEPRLTMAEREFFIKIVYRNENIENVLLFTRDVNSKILSLISKIGDT
jgi:hypothetical protein